MENTCFVIQPFDSGKFDKRYKDVYEPAIRKAGLNPYRVDQDPKVQVPIESIEEGIRQASICLADITTDNPNVWYELGYAFATNRPVIMVCSQERQGNTYPFDIRHRTILHYQTESMSDFEELGTQLTERILERLKDVEPEQSSDQRGPVTVTDLFSRIDRTDLAQGTDQVELHYEYELNENETSTKTTVSETYSTTWDDLFQKLAPNILAPISESRLNTLITSFIEKAETPRIKLEHGEKSSASSFRVIDESLGIVKLQLMALRLIRLSGDGWSLTELGQRQLLESGAIKRSQSSEED